MIVSCSYDTLKYNEIDIEEESADSGEKDRGDFVTYGGMELKRGGGQIEMPRSMYPFISNKS